MNLTAERRLCAHACNTRERTGRTGRTRRAPRDTINRQWQQQDSLPGKHYGLTDLRHHTHTLHATAGRWKRPLEISPVH